MLITHIDLRRNSVTIHHHECRNCKSYGGEHSPVDRIGTRGGWLRGFRNRRQITDMLRRHRFEILTCPQCARKIK